MTTMAIGAPSDHGIPELLGASETARHLKISTRTLATRTATGEVPSVKLGGRRLYDAADVMAYIKRGRG